MREPSDYSAEFAGRLASLGIEAALIGALAAIEYRADPRQTTDVDFLVDRLDGLVGSVTADGYDARTVSDPGGEIYAVFIQGLGAQVDVLRAETPYQLEALRRAIGGVITVEDVIVHKLLAWRARDRDDIRSILVAGHDLDEPYIAHWAGEWQVPDRWAEARLLI